VRRKAAPIVYAGSPQHDLAAMDPSACPTCGRTWNGLAKRVCRVCGKPISSRHKYQLIPAGPGLWAFVHRDCERPDQYRGKGGKRL
jgi:hypothetical protein